MNSPARPRVLFFIGSMGGGGAERQVLEILKRLDRSRFEPLLYLENKQGELLDEVPDDVPIFAYWDGTKESWWGRLLRQMKLTRLLRHIHLARVLHRKKIDLLYDRTYLATLSAASACLLRSTPRVSCCVVDPAPELELYAKWSVVAARWFARRAYQTANIVLTNSEGLRGRFLDYFRLDPNRVQVFHNLLVPTRPHALALDHGDERIANLFASANTERIRLRTSSISDDGQHDAAVTPSPSASTRASLIIVTAGRLHPQKGHLILLQAIDELVHRRGRHLRLIIFGKGESESELRDFVRAHELQEYVTIAGFVSDPRHWYPQADLFVLPSLYEGMPNALIEAVATGLPVLSTDCPSGPSEILDGGRCGRLVPAGDMAALTTGIEDAMDHYGEWQTRAELARQRVTEMFDPEKGIRRLECLFDKILQRSPR